MKQLAMTVALVWGMACTAWAQQPPIIKWADLQGYMDRDTDTLYVLNFWATWCKPCVAEMPHFERLQSERAQDKVQVIFVSLDFRNQYDAMLLPFLKRKKLQSPVMLLDEPKYNDWIDKLDPSWSGAIPATLFVQHSRGIRKFHEGDFTFEELSSTVNDLLSK